MLVLFFSPSLSDSLLFFFLVGSVKLVYTVFRDVCLSVSSTSFNLHNNCLLHDPLNLSCHLILHIIGQQIVKLCIQVQGIVQDRNGKTVATLIGKWDESVHYVLGDCSNKRKWTEPFLEAQLLWERGKPSMYPTRYNLTRFAITMNELTPGLRVRTIAFHLISSSTSML